MNFDIVNFQLLFFFYPKSVITAFFPIEVAIRIIFDPLIPCNNAHVHMFNSHQRILFFFIIIEFVF